jgi:phosphatidylserine decarboxylase
LDVVMESDESPPRLFRIRQITGQFARRIVCWVRPGDILSRGEMFGMIKLGSRTELLVPNDPTLEIIAKLGDKIAAGSTVLGQYHAGRQAAAAQSHAGRDVKR